MKQAILIAIPVLLLFSCKKGTDLPRIETFTSGNKWGIEIGSSPSDVYTQLQMLGYEKKFSQVAVVYRLPYSKPQDIQHLIEFYQTITLQSNTGVINRAVLEFRKDTINSITTGGGLPQEVSHWPHDVADATAIHKGDPVNKIYEKLLAIYQISPYNSYQIILPDKPLEKPFDPDMANYTEWAFSFSERVQPGIQGTSSVRLFFENGKLIKIRHEYNEHAVYN